MDRFCPRLALLVLLAALGAGAQTEDANPETQVRKAFPEHPARIPLSTPEGTTTTLGAVAPAVLLVMPFTSRFGDLRELELAPHLMKALAGREDVALIALNVDRPKSPEDWATLREVLQEHHVDMRLYADAQLAFFAWMNGRPESGSREPLRLPSFAIVLHGNQLHDTYGLDPHATPQSYVDERLAEVKEALKAAKAKPAAGAKPAPKAR
jgi:hypothetical protein